MSSILRFALLPAASVLALPAAPALAYTLEQATAGRAAYEQTCATCHGPTLRHPGRGCPGRCVGDLPERQDKNEVSLTRTIR
jgi:mono/diheme cytochrome c family protein